MATSLDVTYIIWAEPSGKDLLSSENSQSDIPHRVRKSIIISAKFYSSQFSVLKDVIGTVENMGVFNRGFGEDTGSRFRVQIVEKNSKMEELVEYTVRNVLTVLRLKTRYGI